MSKENAPEFSFVWKIHNFSLDFYKNGEAIKSPTFEINSFGGSQWYLIFFPCGECKEDDDFVSVYLYKKRNDIYSEVSHIIYELDLIVNVGESVKKRSSKCFEYALNERVGWNRFLFISTLQNNLTKWSENVLTFRCSMFDVSKQRSLDFEMNTEVLIERISFLWNIKIDKNSSQTVSKEFSFSEKSLYDISLSVFDDDDTIKIIINQRKEESSFAKFVACKLSLINSKKNELTSKHARYCFEPDVKNDVWDFPGFITKEDLCSKSDLWTNGCFSVFCEFVASEGMKSTPIISSKYATAKGDDHSTLTKDLKSMFCNHIHSDIQFKVGKEVIHAHKAILAARSPVFLAMFNRNMLESQTGVVDIPDLDANVLKKFLKFIYIGTVENFDYEEAKILIVVADKYQVQSLKEKCVSFLEAILDLGNAIEILSIADMVNHEHLKNNVLNFIVLNSEVIFKTPEWRDCIQENIKLAGEIISVITNNFRVIPITK